MKFRYLIATCLLASRLAFAGGFEDFSALQKKYNATDRAFGQPRLEKDKYYLIDGFAGQIFFIGQVTDDSILALDVRKQPFAILTFEDPKALEGVQLQKGNGGHAVGKFVSFKTVPMTDGSEQRFPIFSCVGLYVAGPAGYVNTEKK